MVFIKVVCVINYQCIFALVNVKRNILSVIDTRPIYSPPCIFHVGDSSTHT